MTEQEVRGLFTLAGFEILALKQLQNGYYGGSLQSRAADVKPVHIYEEGKTLLDREALDFLNSAVIAAREPWWFVKTQFGWVEIGWRKRVIQINWSDIGGARGIDVTADDVTKDNFYVHAWSIPKALEYLTTLRKLLHP